MPGLVTMKPVLKPRGNCSKAMARAMEERGLGALLSQARVSSAKKGRRSTDLQALGATGRSNLAMRLRMKLLGEGVDDDAESDEDVRSEHEPSSVRLAAMVDDFIEDASNDRKRGRSRFDGVHGEEEPQSSLIEELVAVLHTTTESMPEKVLLAEATNAVAALNTESYIGDSTTNYLRRHVTRHLRRAGFDAGICKSRWDHSGGFPGGGYEYIDVICKGPAERNGRIIIDVDFKAQFEVARPTAHYGALVQALPSIFVGRAEQLQSIVNFMSEAVKLSLKKRGMHLAPWRKPEYMMAKWFSSYKRTANWDNITDGSSSSEDSDVSVSPNADVHSRGMVMAPQKPEEKLIVKQVSNGNRLTTGKGVAATVNSFSNNEWRLPILEARKSQGPGHAGLASLFRKPVVAVQ